MTEEIKNIETIENIEPTPENLEIMRQKAKQIYKEYKAVYNKKRYEERAEQFKYTAHLNYIKRLETDPTYKQTTRDRANAHRVKKIIEQGKEPQTKKGRPKKEKTEETKQPKPSGRPRKYI